MYDTNTTYYLDVACIKSENGTKSPYGEFVDNGAYVVVTYDGNVSCCSNVANDAYNDAKNVEWTGNVGTISSYEYAYASQKKLLE